MTRYVIVVNDSEWDDDDFEREDFDYAIEEVLRSAYVTVESIEELDE